VQVKTEVGITGIVKLKPFIAGRRPGGEDGGCAGRPGVADHAGRAVDHRGCTGAGRHALLHDARLLSHHLHRHAGRLRPRHTFPPHRAQRVLAGPHRFFIQEAAVPQDNIWSDLTLFLDLYDIV